MGDIYWRKHKKKNPKLTKEQIRERRRKRKRMKEKSGGN